MTPNWKLPKYSRGGHITLTSSKNHAWWKLVSNSCFGTLPETCKTSFPIDLASNRLSKHRVGEYGRIYIFPSSYCLLLFTDHFEIRSHIIMWALVYLNRSGGLHEGADVSYLRVQPAIGWKTQPCLFNCFSLKFRTISPMIPHWEWGCIIKCQCTVATLFVRFSAGPEKMVQVDLASHCVGACRLPEIVDN